MIVLDECKGAVAEAKNLQQPLFACHKQAENLPINI